MLGRHLEWQEFCERHDVSMAEAQLSAYYNDLEEKAKSRYREKLEKLGGMTDPYLNWQSEASIDWQLWPDVEYPDIFNYLIESPSVYTGESLKAYRSLDAYNYFVSGWVESVCVVEIRSCKDTYLVTARVRHSQRVSATPVRTWVALKQDGPVVCAHCTCMAGLGEACSHIAALLFTIEGNTQTKKRLTCTSLPCSWLPPSFRAVPFAKLADIDFSTPLQKRKKLTSLNKGESSRSSQPTKQVQEPTEEEVQEFYSELAKTGKPVVLSLVPKHCENFVPLSAKGVLPQPLTHLFHHDYMPLSYLELLDVCE